jgi:hypothetical protein
MALFSVARWLTVAESSVVPELPSWRHLAALADGPAAMIDPGDAQSIETDVPRSSGVSAA